MKKLAIAFLLLLGWTYSPAQGQLPTIRSNSSTLDVKIGDDYFAKGGWFLEPQKKPDVLSIGSKWPYDHKKVSFVTDVDSISFDVQPGKDYDFIILLKDQSACYIRISTLANPLFMKTGIAVPILVGFGLVLLLVFALRRRIAPLPLLYLGYALVFLFWTMTVISGAIRGDYHHLKNVVSQLGAIGTASEAFTSASLIFLALLSLLFSIGFCKASAKLCISVIPAVLTFSKPVSLAWAAFFPLGNELHGATGPLPFLIILASLAAFFLWRRKDSSTLRQASILSFFIMMLILTRFIQPFGLTYEGLVQRFFYAGWSVWTLALAYGLSKRLRLQEPGS